MTEKVKAILMESHCVVNEDGRVANLKASLARGLPVIAHCLEEKKGPLAIVGSGPSLADRLEKLRHWDGDIWAINGAYDYLLENGIIPDGFFGIDPLPGLAEYVQNAQPQTTFYLASTCDPSVFDALVGHDVQLVHFASENNAIYPEGSKVVMGGTTSVTRAPFVAVALGWRNITLFGVDGSYTSKGPYCYHWGSFKEDIKEKIVPVMINKEGPFLSEVGLLKQITQLGFMLTMFNHKRKILKIDPAGLMGAFLRSPMLDDSKIEVVPNEPADDKADAA